LRTHALLAFAMSVAMTALSPPRHAHAQGENHWYNQFGDHSFLLSGAVIGGVSDLGAVFYNPGRLADIESASFFLHANGFQMNRTSVKDAGPSGGDLVVRDYGGSPSFSAGSARLPFWPNHTFAYSYLTRRSRDTRLTLGSDSGSDVPGSFPGIDAASGIVDVDSYVKENWYGLSWSTPVQSDLSVGLSLFAANVNRNHSVTLDTRVASGGSAGALIVTKAHDAAAWGLLAKAGVAVSRGPFELGLTFTTPQIHVWGSGATRYEELIVGIDAVEPGEETFVVDRQRDLPVHIKSPMAVGFGMAWRHDQVVLHLSGEWYSGLTRHTVLESDTIRTPFGETRGRYVLVTELDPVVNVGAGAEWQLNSAFAAFASAASDAAAAPESSFLSAGNEVDTNFLIGDALHFGAGISARTRWFSISTGVTYSGASDRIRRPFPLLVADGRPRLEPLEVSTTTWRLLVAGSILIIGDDN
jgi:hypothetical protein